MTNLVKINFTPLDVSGKNFLSWSIDVKAHFRAKKLMDTIEEGNTAPEDERANALVFLRGHVHENIKDQYLDIVDPYELWNALVGRFDHQKALILPKARFDWSNLRFQDFKTVGEYNSALCKITSHLKLCGDKVSDEDMLEKTFSTFHASNMLLQQQYRERGFTKYSQLLVTLLVAEENNNLLMINHQSRPTGTTPFPEANVVHHESNAISARGDTQRRGRWSGKSNTRGGRNNDLGPRTNPDSIEKRANRNKGKSQMSNAPRNPEGACHRCGCTGHWARTCRTPKHLVELYQASQAPQRGKRVETNFVDQEDPMDTTHLDIADFVTQKENETYGSD